MPDPAVREYQIDYGAVSIGGASTEYLLHEVHRKEIDSERVRLEFSCVVRGVDQGHYVGLVQQLEREFGTPYQDLSIRLGESTAFAGKQGSNTLLDAQPRIVKPGEKTDTGLSCTYRLYVEAGLPADWNTESSGLRRKLVRIAYTPSRRRTITISGEYTAVDGSDASAVYAARIEALASSVISAESGTFELSEESEEQTTNTKVVRFTRVYSEIIHSQAGASTDDSDLVLQSLRVSRAPDNPSGGFAFASPATSSMVPIEATYVVAVDKTSVSGLTALKSKWEGTVKSWIVTQLSTLHGATLAITRIAPEYDLDANTITARISAMGDGGSPTVASSVTATEDDGQGIVLLPVWDGNDGYAHALYQGPRAKLLRITAQATFQGALTRESGKSKVDALIDDGGFLPRGGDGPGDFGTSWVRVDNWPTAVSARTIGSDEDSLDVTDVAATRVYQFIRRVEGGGVTVGGAAT